MVMVVLVIEFFGKHPSLSGSELVRAVNDLHQMLNCSGVFFLPAHRFFDFPLRIQLKGVIITLLRNDIVPVHQNAFDILGFFAVCVHL